MNVKQICGIVCCVVALMLFAAEVISMINQPGSGLTDASGLGISRAVGALLPGTIALIVGVWLLGKKKT